MLHRTELQTIQKTVESLTPSKPMSQTRACPKPMHEWAEGREFGGRDGSMQISFATYTSQRKAPFRSLALQQHIQPSFNCWKARPYKELYGLAFFHLPKGSICLSLPLRKWKSSTWHFPNFLPPFLPLQTRGRQGTASNSLTWTPRFKNDLSKSVYNLNIH